MHVGVALLTLFPGRVGGSETYVRGLLREYGLGRGPEQVTVLANRHVMAAHGAWQRGPVKLLQVRSYRAGNTNPTRLLAMAAAGIAPARVAREVPREVEVMHYPVTVRIPRARVPSVVTLLDVQHHELPEFFSRAERVFRARAYDAAAREADVVVTISEYAKTSIAEHVGVDPAGIEVIPLGIDHDHFRPDGIDDQRLLSPLRLPERFLIYPANLWPHKNHGRLLQAFARAACADSVSLVLTGQAYGRELVVLDQASALGIADRVRHLGHVPSTTMPALYRRAAGMVFPSLYEGFGSPPLEAMACGCPVAASSAGALTEVCADAALLFDPREVDDIAAAIDRLIGDGALRHRLRERGTVRAGSFTWSDAARRHLGVYRRARETREPSATGRRSPHG